MRATLTHVTLIVLLIIAALPKAHAQFERFPGVIKQYEVGYGYSKTWGEYKRTDRAVREDGKVYDTTTSMSVSSNFGFSGQTGTIIGLKQLGRKSKLALGVSFLYNAYTWDYPTANGVFLTDSGLRYDYAYGLLFSGATLNAGLALSADFKFGVDGMMDKRYRWGWTGGIGVLPSANVTSDFDDADLTFGVQPFLKSELALRAGIVWKLRLLYAFGNLKYLDVKPGKGLFGLSNAENTTMLTGKGNFTVSLILMPFSWMYKKSMWYNTY